jgi:23S rRNA pseudouridine1911/1915/1917 synthase
MGKPNQIELPDRTRAAILYEDRSVLAIDKPAGWMLAPESWAKGSRNLQRALMLSVQARDHWARSRNLRYVRFVHRLDAETSGVLLLAKTPGALSVLSGLFETRQVRKKYLAVVRGHPPQSQWICRLKIAPAPGAIGRMQAGEAGGKPAETAFTVLQQGRECALIEAVPVTGRTHQIRLHLAAAGHPVLGDALYGKAGPALALRAVEIAYTDPFQKRPVRITAPIGEFLRRHHFAVSAGPARPLTLPGSRS